jgi:CheY-like chemotaxis protein
MPEGGKLQLKTENVTLSDTFTKPYNLKAGRYVKIVVRDFGKGMDEETQKRIFEPFFTTKKLGKVKGTGLGLASVYGTVKNHHGIIDVKSRPDHGTEFQIHIPVSEKKLPKERPEPLNKDFLKGSETVLIIDDEELILDVASEMLEDIGYKTITARNGKEGLEIYEKEASAIDLIILDMVMPEMSGSEVYPRLKQINPEARVILSSGYSIEDQAGKLMEKGCDGFLQKPYTSAELSNKLQEVLTA